MARMNRARSRGAVLLLAMIFLLLLAMVAGTVMQTSILESRMAGNEQFREEAFQRAQAVASALSEDPSNFPVSGEVGYTICAGGDTYAECTSDLTLTLSSEVTSSLVDSDVTYRVERQGPLFLETLPFRQREGATSSSLAFDAAIFEAQVEVDGSASRLGRAEVAQGVAILVASSVQ
jgi:type II secretory pathway pseudopilin PulG